MHILTINWQVRRDFVADMECEHCGHVETDVSGYDDHHFHQNVIPDMECKECGKKAPETFEPNAPKYRADEIV